MLLKVSLDLNAESGRSLHVTLCWNIINITKCLLSLEFVVWKYRPALHWCQKWDLHIKQKKMEQESSTTIKTEEMMPGSMGMVCRDIPETYQHVEAPAASGRRTEEWWFQAKP